jgi:phospholipase/lecithinase/hemolysin
MMRKGSIFDQKRCLPLSLVLVWVGIFGASRLPAEPVFPEIQSIVVFGDSFSDVGPLRRFDDPNSPDTLWVEYLAESLGLAPALHYSAVNSPEGKSFAVSGSTAIAGLRPFGDGTRQLDAYLNTVLDGAQVPDDALMVVWLGFTDLIGMDQPAVNSADAIKSLLERLGQAGARKFLVPDYFPFGLMPENQADPGAANARTAAFNQRLRENLAAFQQGYPDAVVVPVRVEALFEAIMANPAAYGFENTTRAIASVLGVQGDPQTHLWWDLTHPTSAAHAHIASFAKLELERVLGGVSAESVVLELTPGLTSGTLGVQGPALPTLTVEWSIDGISWESITTFTPFDGLETVPLEGAAAGAPRFYRAR